MRCPRKALCCAMATSAILRAIGDGDVRAVAWQVRARSANCLAVISWADADVAVTRAATTTAPARIATTCPPSCPRLSRASTSFRTDTPQDVDGRDIGERSDAVLRTAMPGHDEGEAVKTLT